MVCLNQSTRYICRFTMRSPPAPIAKRVPAIVQ